MRAALIVVDYQVDFVESTGTLYVPEGWTLGERIESLSELYPLVILTQDWHVPADPSFKEQGGLWPPHCVAGTHGAMISNRIARTQERAMAVVRKRVNSAFVQADRESSTGLDGLLNDHDVQELHFCGLALDYCVGESAMDALDLGWDVGVVAHATLPVFRHSGEEMLRRLAEQGARIL